MKTKIILFLLVTFTYCNAQVVPPDSAKYHEGSLTTVCGKVSGTHTSNSGTIFINFEKSYPNNPFTAVVMAKDTVNFKEYKPAEFLRDKEVCVMGMVKIYKGKLEIIIKSPNQIRIQNTE